MLAKWLARLAVALARDPEKTGHTLLYIILGITMALSLFSFICLGMTGTFLDQAEVLDDGFEVDKTEVYKNIDRVYEKFRGDIQKQMDKREAEIIKENTKYVEVVYTGEDGKQHKKKQAVCNVTVVKSFRNFSYSYLLAYINHSSGVKGLEQYGFSDSEIYGVMEEICRIREEQNGTVYTLSTTVKTPEQVAAVYYPDVQTQEMYVTSFDLYESFLGFAKNESLDNTDDGNPEDPGHSTSLSDDDINAILSDVPPDDEIAAKVLAFATSKLGYPYSQAKRESGSYFDCSSLCYYAYKAAGIDLGAHPPTAAELARYCVNHGTVVSVDNLKPGDLIFYSFKANGRYKDIGHVGIYAGNGMIIDASYSKGYVVYRKLYSRGNIVMCGRPYRQDGNGGN